MELRTTREELIGMISQAFPGIPKASISNGLTSALQRYLSDLNLGCTNWITTRELVKLKAAIEWQIVALQLDGQFDFI